MLGAHVGRVDQETPKRPPRQIVRGLCRNGGTSLGGIFRRIGRASVAEPDKQISRIRLSDKTSRFAFACNAICSF